MFRVCTAGLYLGSRASTPEAMLAAPGPKRMHIVMLREIDANELGKLFTRGMQDNAAREEFSRSIPGTLWLAELLSRKKKLAKGENFSVDHVPGVGTSVLVNGVPQARARPRARAARHDDVLKPKGRPTGPARRASRR